MSTDTGPPSVFYDAVAKTWRCDQHETVIRDLGEGDLGLNEVMRHLHDQHGAHLSSSCPWCD